MTRPAVSKSLLSTNVNCFGWLLILERKAVITVFDAGSLSSVIVAVLICPHSDIVSSRMVQSKIFIMCLFPRLIGALVLFLQSTSEHHRGTDVVVVIPLVRFIFEDNVQLILQIRFLSFSNHQVADMILRVWL